MAGSWVAVQAWLHWINNAASFQLAMAPVSPSATKQAKGGANGIPPAHTATVRHG